jgi:serine/threonine protein phosphatase 1
VVRLADARAPDGLRLYAIGDVHGCLDALIELHRAIAADLSARPAADWRIIHLGDYVDRGADSRGVIDFLLTRTAEEPSILCLRGNHDEMFACALGGEPRAVELWLINGGGETLESYGVPLTRFLDDTRAGQGACDAVPKPHRDFLGGLATSARFGDYYFVHAGIDPSRALDAQLPGDQLWIREPFLTSSDAFEAVIVHGHTPVRRVAVRPNRIGIDTGAVFGGALTCLVLEGASKGLLTDGRIVPLPGAAGQSRT